MKMTDIQPQSYIIIVIMSVKLVVILGEYKKIIALFVAFLSTIFTKPFRIGRIPPLEHLILPPKLNHPNSIST